MQSVGCGHGQLRGSRRHSPPHRQFLTQRCSHCFTAVALLGDLSMVTQPHLQGGVGVLQVGLAEAPPLLPTVPRRPRCGDTGLAKSALPQDLVAGMAG